MHGRSSLWVNLWAVDDLLASASRKMMHDDGEAGVKDPKTSEELARTSFDAAVPRCKGTR